MTDMTTRNLIYAAYENDTAVYVGRTSRGLQKRLAEHLHDAVAPEENYRPATKFHEWLRGHLDAEFRVLEELPDDVHPELLAAAEARWIGRLKPALNSVTPRGYYLALDLLGAA